MMQINIAFVAGAKKGGGKGRKMCEKNVQGEELEGAPALKAQRFPSLPSIG